MRNTSVYHKATGLNYDYCIIAYKRADALSRINIGALPSLSSIDIEEMSKDQTANKEFSQYKDSSSTAWKFKLLPIHSIKLLICCDISTGFSRPFVPEQRRKIVFSTLNNLSPPGIAASMKVISNRLVWHGMNRDIRSLVQSFIQLQKAKGNPLVKAPLGTLGTLMVDLNTHMDIVGPLPPVEGNEFL
ncbi:Hypothetical predicted protein [Octopus vulgaris]|uniref:Uncharacterized protein n=1 Tax=Octopus vulgaris TaxID=6645 RepID=A0AA36AMG8_OCTVU|nr:Hypothetical predicted protein [Octopus vulgaris]